MNLPAFVHDHAALRDSVRVFRDRVDAGHVLAGMLAAYRGTDALVLGVPRGGVEVAAVVAHELGLPLDVLCASKISAPWNEEYGFGVVAADGTVVVDRAAGRRLGLDDTGIAAAIERARTKVERRVRELCGDAARPALRGRLLIVVDDGIATGATVLGAVRAARNAGARAVVLAVPTAHADALGQFEGLVDALYVPNVREGASFGVSEAFERWGDTDIDVVKRLLAQRS